MGERGYGDRVAGKVALVTGAARGQGRADAVRLAEEGAEVGPAMAGDQRLGAMFMNMMPVDVTQPEDVADTVLFLASDESRYITAHELAPDAGISEF